MKLTKCSRPLSMQMHHRRRTKFWSLSHRPCHGVKHHQRKARRPLQRMSLTSVFHYLSTLNSSSSSRQHYLSASRTHESGYMSCGPALSLVMVSRMTSFTNFSGEPGSVCIQTLQHYPLLRKAITFCRQFT
jgi:hypothetical protein